MIGIIITANIYCPEKLAENSVIVGHDAVMYKGDSRFIVYANKKIEGLFDIVLMSGKPCIDMHACTDEKTVVFVASADEDAINSLFNLKCSVVTVGFSEKDTICISSFKDGKCAVSVQRAISFKSKNIDIQELVIDVEDEYNLFAEVCSGLILLL